MKNRMTAPIDPIKSIIALSTRDFYKRSRSLWYPATISLALIVFVLVHNNNWQLIFQQGVVTGNMLSTVFHFSITILLLSLALDASLAIPMEQEAGTLRWLRVQPISNINIVLGKFLGIMSVFIVSLFGLLLLMGCILLFSGIPYVEQPVGIVLYSLSAGVYMVGLGLWIGSTFRHLKSSVGVVILLLLFFLVSSLLGLWLQIRLIPSVYDPYYLLAKFVINVNYFLEWLSPIRLFSQQSLSLTVQDLTHNLVLVLLGCLGLLIAAHNLRRMPLLQ